MKFEFKINPYYLFAHSVERASGTDPFPAWVAFAKKIRAKTPILFKNSSVAFAEIQSGRNFKANLRAAERAVIRAMHTLAFKRLFKETERYRKWVENEWRTKGSTAFSTLKDITGLRFPSSTIITFITHPKLSNGSSDPQKNFAYWGHPEDWENYTVVYLCHELLHILTHCKFQDEKTMHALIELATDNELRIQLNGRGKYFEENRRPVGHQELRNLERKLLPSWKKYLTGRSKAKNILQFEREIHKDFPK